MLPDDGARSKIQAQQLPLLHALLHAAVMGSIAIAIAIESALETGVRFAAHRWSRRCGRPTRWNICRKLEDLESHARTVRGKQRRQRQERRDQ